MIRVGIIGAGAAGIFAACQLKRLSSGTGTGITVLEKNSVPGKKLTLTGHGRCNITNRKDPSELRKGYHEAENFIYPALKEFGPEDTIRFLETELGTGVKEEDNNRIFPVSDSAVRLRDTLVSYLSDSVTLICDAKVTEITKRDCFEVKSSKGTFCFDRVILSCGGSSFPKTGSAGDSYILAEKAGHTIIPIRSALAQVAADDVSSLFTSRLSGVAVRSRVSLICGEKSSAAVTGEVLFTDHGLSGPAVMEISREIPPDICGANTALELDLIPDSDDGQFDRELQELICKHPDTKITTLLANYIPASLAGETASAAGVFGLYAQGFTKENRKKLIRTVKHLRIGISRAPSLEKAYVTRGGVSLKEVDRKTMQSKKISGLYIIGEALDIDGISGGYNLQACMSEAYLAAKSILGR